LRQLGDVARYASSFVKRQSLGGLSIALVGVAVHISDGLLICIYDLEAAASTAHGVTHGEVT
jgi:hypothetical protein